MAICRTSLPAGRGRKRRALMRTSGQAASNKTASRALSWLIGVVALGSIVALGEMRADAQTLLLDDNAPAISTGAPLRLSNAPAVHNEAADNTTGSRTSALVPDPGAEADQRQKNAAPQEGEA